MRIKTGFIAFSCSLVSTAFAANAELIWQTDSPPKLKSLAASRSQYEWRAIEGQTYEHHSRYQLYFKNIPVWGQQQVHHKQNNGKSLITGYTVRGIEKDLPDLQATVSVDKSQVKVEAFMKKPEFLTSEQVIYLDKDQKAHLAWHLAYVDRGQGISMPAFLIDAKTGVLLKHWNEVRQEAIGQGLGGNDFALPYRTGIFQHGDVMPGIPMLGRFEVKRQGKHCSIESPYFRVMNLDGIADDKSFFPVFNVIEHVRRLKAYRYDCSEQTGFLNDSEYRDGTTNHSYSVMNDTMYFATKTYEMYENYYHIKKPLGNDLPVRAYTHIAHYDNAAAIPTLKIKGLLLSHQQIVIGDGDSFLTAASQSVIAHELSHNFTELHSQLVYEGQSGGINEAFSDMASFAMMDYLRLSYPWYWDGKDWSLGREAVIGGEPLRYIDDPTKDGSSIGDAKDYNDSLDVHQTSGVFNKAFYLLATTEGWSVRRAFEVMLDANQNYWMPNTSFEAAACGVIQAAKDRNYNKSDVIAAFGGVGVVCPMKI